MSEAVVSQLWTYPVKSCQGVATDSIQITSLGVTGDRCFAIWAEGRLVEQKLTPYVASIGAAFDSRTGVLTLTHADKGVHAHQVRSEGPLRPAKWLLDEFRTVDQGDPVAEWLSEVLDKNVRLVMPHDPWRINFPVPQMALLHDHLKHSFTAASPVGLANQASLDDLNTRVDTSVPMDRFRVNVVIDGLDAYEEDHVHSLSTDDVELLQVTAAERCVIITTDQRTGGRPENNLMETLSTYRKKSKEERFASGLKFGSYMIVAKEGTLRVGDRLSVT
ncbi:MAG: MOSC domain-containing protein [Actinomycetia bacterium]|nr:MOSC domain-containing protein [Actinomycetes bacterium]MCP4228034.1 MOSC domain-containing protein [Actinomycetes bacterium]MCP5035266.1 MOSC domain-containing protein [Actinomycetes bacterium]